MTETPLRWWLVPRVIASLALLMTTACFILSYPGLIGWTKRVALTGLAHEEGYRWSASLPDGFSGPRGRNFLPPDRVRVLENGLAVERPAASERHIANGGWGRFRIDRNKVSLSASDEAGPEGRRYDVEIGAWYVAESALLLLWGVSVALWVWAARCGWRPPLVPSATLLPVCFGVFWVFGLMVSPVTWSAKFFETLWLPVLWSCGVAVLAMRGSALALAGLLIFSLIPAAATYFHYAVGGASHSSFVVAGAVPWSDAWVHFHQGAQIALFGITDYAFNGRYFYPVALAAALWVAGWNLQLALALIMGLALLAVALLARLIRPIAGLAGVSFFVLGCTLYLRAHVAGICMTESLGFLAGALGTAGLVVAGVWRSPHWFFSGLFLLSFGMAARPGALLVLPALGICAAIMFGLQRPARMLLFLLLGAAIVVAPFVANASLGRVLTTDNTKPFNNFAFSFHGMLLGKGWEESAAQTEHNPGVAMQRGKELFLAKPWLILSAYQRALDYLARKHFLFRSGEERRIAATINLLAGLGLIGIWFMPGWRPHALWMAFAAGGLILSLPFAPPWDASERPFAVTVPMQCLCAAAGAAWISAGLHQLCGRPTPLRTKESGKIDKVWIGALFAFAMLALVVAVGRAWMILPAGNSPAWPPDFRRGSASDVYDLASFRERLSVLLAKQGDRARIYLSVGRGAVVGIDWSRLAPIAAADPPSKRPPELLRIGSLLIDPSVQIDPPNGAGE